MSLSNSLTYLVDPYYETRLNDARDNNSKYNIILLICFSLASLGFALGIFQWFVLTLLLAFTAMVKAYYYVQIKRYEKTLLKIKERT